MHKNQLVSQVANTLNEADFEVSRIIPYGSCCFDIAARRDLVLMMKILVNVDSMDSVQAEQLKRICHLVSGYPLLVGDRTRTEKIEDDVVHERYDLPAINIETLRLLIESGALPLIYGTKGGYYVRIDGKTLKEERKRRGLSLGQLGEMVGVSRESIYNYEHNGSASIETAMALVEELGVELIEPVRILKRVEMHLRPDQNIENELLRFVALKLNDLGFGVYRTPRTPFHAVAEEPRDKLVTGVFEHYRNLKQHAQVISSLSHVIDITTFLVSHETPNLENIEGLAILREEEFEDIDKKSELSGMIKDKQHA